MWIAGEPGTTRAGIRPILQADPAQTLAAFSPAPDDRFLRSWLEADATMRSALDEHLSADETPSGPAVAQALGPVDDVVVVLASSMPVRTSARIWPEQGG